MTYAQREEIFAKEYISINDLRELLGLTYGQAARVIREIKRKSDRLCVQGKVHVQDYIEYFNLPLSERYTKRKENENGKEIDY